MFEQISKLLEKYSFRFVLMLIAVVVLIPVFVWLCYSVFPAVIQTKITADGMLSYLGAAVGSIASLTLAAVAIHQSHHNQEFQEDVAYQNRRNEIRPVLCVHVEENDDGNSYDLVLKNCSDHLASSIYLFDIAILGHMIPGSERRVTFTFDEDCTTGIWVSAQEAKRNEDGFPTYILLQCYDVDQNLLVMECKLSDVGEGYIVTEHWYS